MLSDPRSVLISQRAGYPLLEHMFDWSYNWHDRYLFVSVGVLGPIDVDSPPPARWGFLTILKNRTNVVAVADLEPQEKNTHSVLIRVFCQGPVSVRELGVSWTHDKYLN